MTDIVPASSKKLDNGNDSGPWYEGIHGEHIAVRLSSLDTNGAYAISNARIASFLPYAQIMPEIDLLITNGGYGTVSMAISHGIPIIRKRSLLTSSSPAQGLTRAPTVRPLRP